MSRKQSIFLTISSLFVIALLTLGCGQAISPTAQAAAPAQASSDNAVPRLITVIGEGRIIAQPDIAQVTIGVETFGDEVKTVAAQTEETMTNLLETLKAQGIAEKDIQTSNYSVYTERFGPMEMSSNEVNYRFSNNVTVTVRDLDKIESILGAVIEAGANNIYGVNFSVADPSELRKQARAKAVEVAESKAAELAQLNGVAVGPVVSISEVVGSVGPFYNSAAYSVAEGFGGGGPISPGELEFSVQLQISYAIQ